MTQLLWTSAGGDSKGGQHPCHRPWFLWIVTLSKIRDTYGYRIPENASFLAKLMMGDIVKFRATRATRFSDKPNKRQLFWWAVSGPTHSFYWRNSSASDWPKNPAAFQPLDKKLELGSFLIKGLRPESAGANMVPSCTKSQWDFWISRILPGLRISITGSEAQRAALPQTTPEKERDASVIAPRNDFSGQQWDLGETFTRFTRSYIEMASSPIFCHGYLYTIIWSMHMPQLCIYII